MRCRIPGAPYRLRIRRDAKAERFRISCTATVVIVVPALLLSIGAGRGLGAPRHGTLDAQILSVDGQLLKDTHVRLLQARLHHLPRGGPQPGEAFVGGPSDTTWMKTDERGVIHLEFRTTPASREGDERSDDWELFYNVSAWAPNQGASHPIAVRIEANRRSRAVLQLVSAGEVAGRIVDVKGQPMVGVSVEACAGRSDFLEMYPTMPEWVIVTKSGLEGVYRFQGLVPGEYDLTAWGAKATPVFGPASSSEVTVEPNAVTRRDLRVITEYALRGHVVDARGRPLDGAGLMVLGGSGSGIGRDGRFEFDLTPGWMVHSRAPRLEADVTLWVTNFDSHMSGPIRQPALAGSAHVDLSMPLPTDIQVRLQRTGTLLFDVREGTRLERVRYINVNFFSPGQLREPAAGDWPWETQGRRLDMPCRSYAETTETGELQIEGVPPGEYDLWVWHGGARGARASVGRNPRVRLEPGERLRLDPIHLVSLPRLVVNMKGADSTLSRVGAFHLSWAPMAAGPARENPHARYSKGSGQGSVLLPESGRFRGILRPLVLFQDVDYTRQGGTVSPVFEFEAVDGIETHIDLELRVAPRLRVEVRRSGDVPGLGHYVRIEARDPHVPIPPIVSPVTFRGDIQSAQLPPGGYVVSVLGPDHLKPLVSRRVELEATETVSVVRIAIP